MLKDEKIFIRRTDRDDLEFIKKEELLASNDGYVALWTEQEHINAFSTSNTLHLVIEEVDSKEVIGYMILNGLEDPDDNLELMRLVISKKGYGYGPRAISLIKKCAFTQLPTNRLWLDVRMHNTYAHELYKSIGFVEEGILRNCVKLDDKYVSIAVLSILKSEYLASTVKKNS